jgi:hypothetical protein
MSDIKIGGAWQTAVAPTVAKLKLAAAIKQDYTLNSVGCAALAKVISDMAMKLDTATSYIKAMEKERQ